MLLNLALDFTDCFNQQTKPVVMQSFERVVEVESQKFTEVLFD
jgi:hypothetical protein